MHSTTLDLLLSAGLTALLALLGYVARTMAGLNKTVGKLDQHLFGPEGGNGLTSEVAETQAAVREIHLRVQELDRDVAVLKAKRVH